MSVKIEFDDGTEITVNCMAAAETEILSSFGQGGLPIRIYDVDGEGEEIENGKEYSCDWSVSLVEN